MSKFLTGKDLEKSICNIIWQAQEKILIVSPYIKLDDYFRKLFSEHKKNHDLHIIIVFGKNENNLNKSLSRNDLDFFKEFPNISIIHAPELHGKYYGNENKGVVTSMNFYDYSFDNNIEFGVYTEHNILSRIGSVITGNDPDNDAWDTCYKIASTNNVVFIKRPVFENLKFLINISRNYIESTVLYDSTENIFNTRKQAENKKLEDYPEELELGAIKKAMPERNSSSKKQDIQQHGYCIRTGEQIPFNPKQPMTYSAWQIWNEYKNLDFRENYCHKTGKPSYGKTSMRNPILEN